MESTLTYKTAVKVEPLPSEPFDKEWGVGISGNTPEPSPFPRINRILHNTAKTTNGFVAPDRAVLVTEAYKKNPGAPQIIKCAEGMANVLRQCHMETVADNTLEITKAGNSFTSAYLDEPENIEKLKGFCIDFFGPETKIKIVEGAPEKQEPVKPSETRPSENVKTNSEEFPRPVQDILEMFQGKIKEETPAGD